MSKWRYYEGTTSSGQILKDMAKVLCTAVKDKAVMDAEGNVVKPAKTIPSANWDIVHPAYDSSVVSAIVDVTNPTPEEFDLKITNQISKITDTVILKTKTSPKAASAEKADDLGLENDLAIESIDMYLELYKPKYLADPEQYNPETERFGIMPYLVTKDIYKEFASTKGEAKFLLGNIQSNPLINEYTADKITRNPDIEDEVTLTNMTANALKIGDTSNEGKVMQYLAQKLSLVPTIEMFYSAAPLSGSNLVKSKAQQTMLFAPGTGTSSKFVRISMEEIKNDMLNNPLYSDILDRMIKMFGDGGVGSSSFGSKFFALEFKVTPTPRTFGGSAQNNYYYLATGTGEAIAAPEAMGQTNWNPVSAVGSFNVEARAIKATDKYTVLTGFNMVLNNPEKINVNTMKLTADGTVQAKNTVWKFNSVTGLFEIIKTLPEYDFLADKHVVLSFEYEKEQATVTDKKLIYNNHYLYARIYDKYDPAIKGPVKNVVDPSTGEIVVLNGHTSEWAKLSWYQDFEEILIDELDTDVGQADLSQGTVFLPIQTPGLNNDTRLRMWANVSNDRVAMVLMGNPSLDFAANRHLTSMFYVGQIESFANSINDTAGNFALMTSSSTVPCDTKTKINRTSTPMKSQIARVGGSNTIFNLPLLPQGQYYDEAGGFVFYSKKQGESIESQISGSLTTVKLNAAKQGGTVEFTFEVEATASIYCAYSAYQERIEQIEGITRDVFGNVLEIKYPETWGKNTATGVTDVCMLHTRSKAYFQKHHFMFTSTEEYMTKEMYGKSAYTGEYYADRIKITHGNDGPRGMLQDVLVIDQSSLVALDELIVNRNFEKDAEKPQETYVFFPINAPYSPFSGSPNALFGLAVKKEHILPAPKDDAEAVQRVIDDLYIGTLTNVMSDLFLPTQGDNGVTIAWTSSDATVIAVSDPE